MSDLSPHHVDATISPNLRDQDKIDADISDYALPNQGTGNLSSQEDDVIAYDSSKPKKLSNQPSLGLKSSQQTNGLEIEEQNSAVTWSNVN